MHGNGPFFVVAAALLLLCFTSCGMKTGHPVDSNLSTSISELREESYP